MTKIYLMLARQYSDDVGHAVVLDADGAGLGKVFHFEVVLLQDGRRDDGQRSLRLAAKLSLQAVFRVNVSTTIDHSSFNVQEMGSGCGSVASSTRGLRFESSHRQYLY